jgi:hypothetical protein
MHNLPQLAMVLVKFHLTGVDNFEDHFRRLHFTNKTISTMLRNTPTPTVVAMIMNLLESSVLPLSE